MMYSGRPLTSSKRFPTYLPNTPIVSNCTPPKNTMSIMVEVQPVTACPKENIMEIKIQSRYNKPNAMLTNPREVATFKGFFEK